jgi:hypothetical protein
MSAETTKLQVKKNEPLNKMQKISPDPSLPIGTILKGKKSHICQTSTSLRTVGNIKINYKVYEGKEYSAVVELRS